MKSSTSLDRFCLTASLMIWVALAALLAAPTLAQNTPQGEDAMAAASPTDASSTDASAAPQWPLQVDTSSGQITVYQPQMTNFDGDKLTARAAVSVIPPGQQDPIFGAIWMESRVSTDRVARTVQILDITVTKARFPDAAGPTEQTLTDVLRKTLPQQPMTLSLDQLLSMMQVVDKEKAAVKDISTSPPQILFRSHAAVLVQFDGDPRFEPADNSAILRAVNTPFFVALDPQSKAYFLKGGGQWFSAPAPLGPYQSAGNAPPPVSALADSSGYKDPQQALSPAQAAGIEIVTATQPSELIWTDGPEQLAPLAGTGLLYVANTDCDIFLLIDTQQIYICVSGRWFTAPHKAGPWTYVAADKLPPDFSRIEPQSPKGEVLAHVAGTQEAKDAVADTFVPQTASINRQNFQQPDVQYDGDPQFQPVPDTTCSYAVNTPDAIVQVDNQYYCCSNAVWYVGHGPRGPWGLCERVPQVIYTIPPSCPIYPCRYVHVYDVTPDVIYCGYLPGYVGCYHYDGVVVYGTGYVYHPWIGREFYPRPYTYGFAAHYDDYHNHWGFSIGLAFGSGAAWIGDRPYAPVRDDWFGHGGYRPAIIETDRTRNIYRTNIVENRTVIHNAEYNVYDRRKDVRYDANARAAVRTPARGDYRSEVGRSDIGRSDAGRSDVGRSDIGRSDVRAPAERATAARGSAGSNNVYADSSGNVYRKTADGWERRENNKWSSDQPDHSSATPRDATPRDATPRETTPRETTPRETTPRETTPRESTPRSESPAGADHSRSSQTPSPTPARSTRSQPDQSSLDRDYQARVQGEQRSRDASQAAPRESRSSDSGSSRDSGASRNGGSSRDGGSSDGGGGGNGGGNGGANGGGHGGGSGGRGH